MPLLSLGVHGSTRRDPSTVDFSDDSMRAGTEAEYSALPDIADRDTHRRVRCGACRAAALEFRVALLALDRDKGGRTRVRSFDRVEALDHVCAEGVRAYGLQLRDNKPTERFSKDPAISRATGDWVTMKLTAVCGELLSDYDEEVMELYMGKAAVFSRVLCENLYGACNGDDDGAVVQDEL